MKNSREEFPSPRQRQPEGWRPCWLAKKMVPNLQAVLEERVKSTMV
jgi:hypothetical protein